MPNVFYTLENKRVEVEPEETILRVSLRTGILHAHACGGNARCSTCRIFIINGLNACAPRNSKEQALADRLHFSSDIRLACQTTITNDVEVRRLVLDDEDLELTDQQGKSLAPGLVGEEKRLAILFADIRGFTPFAESRPPYDIVHILNRYFHKMGQVVSRNGGQMNNYMGDGFLALFGMNDGADSALRAVKAGLEMLVAMESLKLYLDRTYQRSFGIGIGIHYGDVVVGAMGSEDLKRVTVIGDAVNFASRIEAANKREGTRLLVSAETYAEVRDRARTGKEVRVALPGKSGEYTLHEITGLK
jgi:adenylate cyclase